MMRGLFQRVNFDSIVLSSFFIVGGGTLWQAATLTNIHDAVPCEEYLPVVSLSPPLPAARPPFHISKTHLNTLNKDGLVVITNIFSQNKLCDMRKAADSIHAEGRMQVTSNKTSVRQDTVCWIRPSDGIMATTTANNNNQKQNNNDKDNIDDSKYHNKDNKNKEILDVIPEFKAASTDERHQHHDQHQHQQVQALPPCLLEGIALLREVAVTLERAGYSRSHKHMVPQHCQLARYEGNQAAQYVAHRDAMENTFSGFLASGLLGWLKTSDYRQRCITAILYLNKEDWDSAAGRDGGALCCYMGAKASDDTGDTATALRRITPSGGTLVIFDSAEILHAVEPSNSCRYALTLWITGEKIAVADR